MATTEHDIVIDNVYEAITKDGWFEFLVEEETKDILMYLVADYGLSSNDARKILNMYQLESYANSMNDTKWS